MYGQLIHKLKKGSTHSRRTLVSPAHLNWLANYVKTLGNGKMVECGVARGGCIALCNKANPNLTIIGLDSWEGMPGPTEEDDKSKCQRWVGSKWGTEEDVYASYKLIESSSNNLTLIKGWFDKTIPNNIELFNDLDILRIDSDLYTSVKFCLETLYDKVKPKGLIILDDWHFNPSGVRKAVNDFLDNRNINVDIHVHEKGRGPSYFFKPDEVL
jgi:asparagine synthase (glutamine-hydrolysing)